MLSSVSNFNFQLWVEEVEYFNLTLLDAIEKVPVLARRGSEASNMAQLFGVVFSPTPSRHDRRAEQLPDNEETALEC